MKYHFKERFKYFLDFGYVHGIRYLGDRCGYLGKIFWFGVITISAFAMSHIFFTTLNSFQQDIVNINLDTSYLHWQNTFPAISICFNKGISTKQIEKYIDENNSIKKPSNQKLMKSFIKTIQNFIFMSPLINMNECQYCSDKNDSFNLNDIKQITNFILPHNCSQFIINLIYMDKRINDCSSLFKYHQTEMGICFIANSIQDFNFNWNELPMKYDRTNFKRKLEFSYAYNDAYHLALYVHSPELMPYFNMEHNVLVGQAYNVYGSYNTIEFENSYEVYELPIKQRQCRFPNEKLENIQHYSISSCFTQLRIGVELKQCNCSILTSPNEYKELYCNYIGTMCLNEIPVIDMTKDLHYEESTKCMQSCIGMEINEIQFKQTPQQATESDDVITNNNNNSKGYNKLKLEIQNMPTVRYIRNVAKTNLDLVVSIGGVIGLFFGASILSIIEIIYIWFIRKF